MDKGRLKTAVIGLKDAGTGLVATAAQLPHFDIVAVADKDIELAEKTAAQFQCRFYDDYRQLVIGNELDCLIVTAGIYSCLEQLRTAIKKRFNIFKTAPLSRNFEEAGELIRLAEAEAVKLSVAVPLRFSPGFELLKSAIRQQAVERLSVVTVTCNYRRQQRPAWHLDPALAGGGVLLRDCYEVIDFLVSVFGVPQQVYSLLTNTAADRQQRHSITEDSAIVTMTYPNDLCVNLIATRSLGPDVTEVNIKCIGRNASLILSDKHLRTENRQGEKTEQKNFKYEPEAADRQALESFAMSIVEPAEHPLKCGGREQLKNMAVLEAAYLSARTSMPEQPQRILALDETQPTLFRPAKR